MIHILVAQSKNRVIGKNNSIPWHNKEDFQFFKQMTTNNTVVMGRKTWDSLPKKPLKDRVNIVISSQKYDDYENVHFCKTITDAIHHEAIKGETFIIGGASVYEQVFYMDVVDYIFSSVIPGDYEGDTFFPEIDLNMYCVETLQKLNMNRFQKN
jgi:dihydrofolate reductase